MSILISGQNEARDILYILDCGAIFASENYEVARTTSYQGSILLSCDGQPFTVVCAGQEKHRLAVAIAPGIALEVRAKGCKLLCMHVGPRHVEFRRFASIGGDGLIELEIESVEPFGRMANAAYRGLLTRYQAGDLLNALARAAARSMPPQRAIDARTKRILHLLERRPECSVSELSRAFGISFFRMSHLFRSSVGISIRTYKRWYRLHTASRYMGSKMSFTEIAARAGYHSLSHFSRDFQEAFGMRPRRLLFGKNSTIINSLAEMESSEPVRDSMCDVGLKM